MKLPKKGLLASRVGESYELDPESDECIVRVIHRPLTLAREGHTLIYGEASHGETDRTRIKDSCLFPELRIRAACAGKAIQLYLGLTY